MRAKKSKVKTGVRAGGQYVNHNQTLISKAKKKVKTGVRAGGQYMNHNQTIL